MLRVLFCLLMVAAPAAQAGDYTALDRYIETPDGSYRYQLVGSGTSLGVNFYVLDLASQTWLTSSEVDRTEWHHWLIIMRPDHPVSSTALLFIDGGSNGDAAPKTPDLTLLPLVLDSGAVIAQLKMVPNQPLRFAGSSAPLSEDALIAYTWQRFLNTGDDRWPARLPMTKAAVRAMDAVTAFCASDAGGKIAVNRFVVTGASKRGWTTWSAAEVDPRVVAIAPIVADLLNMEKSFVHHFRSYGFWAPAIQDYVNSGLMNWLGTPQLDALMEIEDPYEYRDRMTLPKYIINSTGDQFFLPDSSQFYFDDLPGEKYLRYVPNTDHSLGLAAVTSVTALEAGYNLLAWFESVLANTPRPRFYWKADRSQGSILLRTIDAPAEVRLWQASNPKARDFRLDTIGPAWTSTAVNGSHGIYTVQLPKPAQGWTAFFLELTYPSGGKYPWKFTTEVVVAPDVYPFGPPAPQSQTTIPPRSRVVPMQ
jgi:PhoPQ-activated pathogenicity-related protein